MLYSHQYKDIPTLSDADLKELHELITAEVKSRVARRNAATVAQQLADTEYLRQRSLTMYPTEK